MRIFDVLVRLSTFLEWDCINRVGVQIDTPGGNPETSVSDEGVQIQIHHNNPNSPCLKSVGPGLEHPKQLIMISQMRAHLQPQRYCAAAY